MKPLCLGLVAAVSLLPGCALTSKADALSPRYFNPQVPSSARSPAAAESLELKLGQVSSAANLDERMAYRISSTEVGFYDDRRWTELPEAYLRRALERDLFEQRRLKRVVSGIAPVLDVELTAFEELRQQPPKVRVSLTFSLRDERHSRLERSLTLEQPASGGSDPAQNVAQALATTLSQAVRTLGDEVVRDLVQPASPDTAPANQQ